MKVAYAFAEVDFHYTKVEVACLADVVDVYIRLENTGPNYMKMLHLKLLELKMNETFPSIQPRQPGTHFFNH